MPRKIFLQSTQNPYHISARFNNQEWFPISQDQLWEIFENYLYFIKITFNLKIHSFVMMKNHFHLLVSSPDGNLSEAMRYFMTETSREIGRRTGRINHIYGKRFFRCEISNYHYFLCVYKYVYRNPCEAGIAKHVLDYKYSTLHNKLGCSKGMIPYEFDTILFEGEIAEVIHWLNDVPEEKKYSQMKIALKRNVFKLSPLRNKKPNPLSYEKY